MSNLSLYRSLSRIGRLNYRGKIMVMAFLGTHIPLLALIGFFVLRAAPDSQTAWLTLGVALAATLIGTAITLWVLNQLLQPIIMTSRALRAYRSERTLPDLPTEFTDEVGTLMADAVDTLQNLDTAIDGLANYDKATGLPNASMLKRSLVEHIAAGDAFPLAVVTISNFDKILAAFENETAGAIAWKVSRDLNAATIRTGGAYAIKPGQFAVVLAAEDFRVEPVDRLAAIVSALMEDVTHAGHSVRPEVQVGMAFAPDDASDAEELIDAAISAASSVGTEGTSRFEFFSTAARDEARQRFLTEQDLRRAIVADEFELHLQPVIDLSRGRAVGGEALIRWRHPERGLVMPNAFIPIAESSGLIDSIGLWVVRAACTQLQRWAAEGNDQLDIAINLSARQFLDLTLVDVIRESLAEAGVSPHRLEIELTETAAMKDSDGTAAIFKSLRDLGVRVAIDDFGTGYSNLSYLKNLAFDKLKIDREFVSGVDQSPNLHAISSALVRLARGLGATVVAEGTEREEEVRLLFSEGCSVFQGYYFAKPVEPKHFVNTINDLGLGRRMMSIVGSMDGSMAEQRRSVA